MTASARTSRRGPRAAAVAIAAGVLAAVLAACGGPAQHEGGSVSRPQPPAALGGVTLSVPLPDSICGCR